MSVWVPFSVSVVSIRYVGIASSSESRRGESTPAGAPPDPCGKVAIDDRRAEEDDGREHEIGDEDRDAHGVLGLRAEEPDHPRTASARTRATSAASPPRREACPRERARPRDADRRATERCSSFIARGRPSRRPRARRPQRAEPAERRRGGDEHRRPGRASWRRASSAASRACRLDRARADVRDGEQRRQGDEDRRPAPASSARTFSGLAIASGRPSGRHSQNRRRRAGSPPR